MWKYQKSMPGLPEETKWGLMNKIFDRMNSQKISIVPNIFILYW